MNELAEANALVVKARVGKRSAFKYQYANYEKSKVSEKVS